MAGASRPSRPTPAAPKPGGPIRVPGVPGGGAGGAIIRKPGPTQGPVRRPGPGAWQTIPGANRPKPKSQNRPPGFIPNAKPKPAPAVRKGPVGGMKPYVKPAAPTAPKPAPIPAKKKTGGI